MEQRLRDQIALLLAEAEQAVDERSNGLMDRSDLRHLIGKLMGVTRILAETCEQIEQEQEDLTRRLSRSSSAIEISVPLGFPVTA